MPQAISEGKTRDKVGEAVALGRALEPLEKKAAKERMLAGVESEPWEKFPQGSAKRKPKAIERVAAAVGMSGPEIQRGPTLFDHARTDDLTNASE